MVSEETKAAIHDAVSGVDFRGVAITPHELGQAIVAQLGTPKASRVLAKIWAAELLKKRPRMRRDELSFHLGRKWQEWTGMSDDGHMLAELQRVSIHEAGHLVAGFLLDIPLTGATASFASKKSYTLFNPAGTPAKYRAVFALAGGAAEAVLHAGDACSPLSCTSGADLAIAREALVEARGRTPSEAELARAGLDVAAMFRNHGIADATRGVATMLRTAGHGQQVEPEKLYKKLWRVDGLHEPAAEPREFAKCIARIITTYK